MTNDREFPARMSRERRALSSAFIALIAGFFCHAILSSAAMKADLYLSLQMARDLIDGADPYRFPVGPDTVPYPLPAAFVALPFSLLPDPLSSGVFIGLSSGLLAWLVLAHRPTWLLGIFLSWPFVYSVFFAQWTPLITCLWFLPALMPLILVKPQIALPMILTGKPNWRGVILTALLLALSLVIYPTWPWVWLGKISGYQGIVPPLLAVPLGPVLLLALRRWRDRRAWLIVLMALMPQRVVYDQLPLLLVATTWRELAFMVSLSWLTMPALLYFGGWKALPGGWPLWIIATLYLPALLVVLRSRGEDKP
jgi:hypothetical protein